METLEVWGNASTDKLDTVDWLLVRGTILVSKDRLMAYFSMFWKESSQSQLLVRKKVKVATDM